MAWSASQVCLECKPSLLGVQAKFAWSASQVWLEYKPSLLGVQVKFAWSASQVTLHDKFAWSASQVALRDKPPSLSDLGVKATPLSTWSTLQVILGLKQAQ